MKVLMINSVSGIRSTGRICTDLADELIIRGHEVKIAFGRECVPKQYEDISYYMSSKIDSTLHALSSRLLDNHGCASKNKTKKFIHWIKEYDPDIIHLHNIHGYYLNYDVLFDYLKKCNKPIIWTMHDCWAVTGHCAYFTAISCNKYIDGCHDCEQKHYYPKSLLIDNSKKNWGKKRRAFQDVPNMTIVTPSNWLKEILSKSILSDYRVEVIHNGIDTKVFRPIKQNKNSEEKVVLGVVSGWDDRKGYTDFLSIASRLINEKYQFVMVGLSKEQIKDLPQNVIGIEKTNNTQELARLYSSADVFLNLTYEDNYPTTNLEAQACGLPVITYKTGGSIESVPKENWVNVGDIDNVIKKMRDNLKIQEMNFSKKQMIEKYINLYMESLK